MSSCAGHCCREFTLPETPWDLMARAAKGEREGLSDFFVNEVRTIATMVRFVKIREPGEMTPDGRVQDPPAELVYTCSRLNVETGRCTRYDERPNMCRMFPYGRSCPYLTCASAAARAGLVDEDGRVHLAMLKEEPCPNPITTPT